MSLELRDPPGAVSQDSDGAEYVSLPDTGAEQHGERRQDWFVVFSNVLVLTGSRQPKAHVHVLQRLEGDTGVLTELRECAVGPGMTSPRALQIAQREMARGVGGSERRRIQSFRVEFYEHPCPHNVAATEHTVFGHEKSELDEFPKALDANPRALRDLLFG